METKIGGEVHHFYGPGAQDFVLRETDLKGDGKRSLEWDLNDWKWDGDLFIASPLNSVTADCRSRQSFPVREIPVTVGLSNSLSSCSDEINLGNEKGKGEMEKRRRVVIVEDDELNDEAGNLTLKLGGNVYPVTETEVANWDEKNGKKTKLGSTSNRAVCQVEDCGTDLSDARDYHRRHKVCEIHSKASQALVGNSMQRFCQQCSRFHVLQEFDEGKRSCRRRLAGHNRRRRKTLPDAVVNGSSLNNDPTSSYLLITLLKILSNIHANNSDRTKDQDLLSHLLKNLASLGTIDGRNISGLLQESQDLLNVGTSAGTSSEMVPALLSNGTESSRLLDLTSKNIDARDPQMKTIDQNGNLAASVVSQKEIIRDNAPGGALQTSPFPNSTTPCPREDGPPAKAVAQDSAVGRIKLNNIDLNNIYNDSQDYTESLERSQSPANLGTGSLDCPSWLQKNSHQSSPPQTSGNSDSASAQSPSSSTGDAQSRTDRIVFKLFGKDPNDFPLVLRAQILDWLSHSPTDIESYIRPGCIILTIYLRLAESTWQELCGDLSSCLRRLLDVSTDTFWTTGWVYIRVQHRIAFIHNGHVVLDTRLPLRSRNHCRISSITPIAVSVAERTQFIVKGFNLSQPTTKLLCALEGKYLLQEGTRDLVITNTLNEYDELQYLSFNCTIPDVTGRGFIEVEDNGLSGGFFPFIVAEQDVCSEIRMLESAIEVVESDDDIQGTTVKMEAKNQALDFIHEMGWLLHKGRLRCRLDCIDFNSDVFPFTRFRWLMEFSMDRDWCAVVKKLLDILFDGTVGAGEFSSIKLALSEMGLLHRAVRRSCKQMVELLLGYVPKASEATGSETDQQVKRGLDGFLFRPDVAGSAGLTPLHVVASIYGSENVLDALTNDPGLVGVEAWKSARDNTGFTPEDYARLRGHYSYIHLVHRKINKKSETGHVILDIPGVLSDSSCNQRQTDKQNSAKVTSFQINKTELKPIQIQQYCKLCDQQLTYGNISRSLVYRPVMLSLMAIAAVCVCVGLLFKSSPEVMYVYPFRWELLDYGPM